MTCFLALALAGGWSAAEAATTADSVPAPQNLSPQLPPGFGLDSRSFQFPSGLRVIMQPDHSAPVVAITTFIDHGSRSDPKGKEGIAHFLEHMWFKSRHVEDSQIKTWDVLESAGCNLNASTSMDWTNYMTVCPKEALPMLMRYASYRLTDTIKGVRPEEADSEREVIRNELRMRGDGTFRNAYTYALKGLFPEEHPYNRLGIGTHDSLDNCSLDDIADFAKKHYVADETTIVVVGDFNAEEAGSLIVESFAPHLLHPDLTEDLIRIAPRPGVSIDQIDAANPDREKVYFVAMDPANPKRPLDVDSEIVRRNERFGLPVGDPATREVQTYEAPVENLTAITAWSLPSGYQGEDVVGFLASGQVGRALARVFVGEYDVLKRNGFPSTACSYLPFQENSVFFCFTEVLGGRNAERIAERMLDQLTDIWNPERLANPIQRGYTELGFGLSRLNFLTDTLTSMDRVSGLNDGRGTLIGGYAHHTGDHQYHSTAMNDFGQVAMPEVLAFVQQYITRDRAAKVILKPLPEDKLVLDSSESDYVGAANEDDKIVSMVSDDKITKDVILDEVRTPDFGKLLDEKLSNGLRVVVYPHGEAPLVSVRLVSNGGSRTSYFDMDTFAGLFSADKRYELTADRTSRVLEPLRIAAGWSDRGGSASSALGIDAPSMNVADALWYVRARLDSIKPDFDGKGDYIRRRTKGIKRSWTSPGYWQTRVRNEAMGMDHPAFRVTPYEHVTRMKKTKKGDVQSYLDQKFHPENMTLVIVGAVDAKEALAAARQYFGGWRTEASSYTSIEVPEAAPIKTYEPKLFLFDDKRSTQTDVTATCRLANDGREARADRALLRAMIGSELFAELRAKEGITYGAGAGAQTLVGNTHIFLMNGLFQNDGVGIATDAFIKMAKDGSQGKFPMHRFKAAQLSLARKPGLGLQAIEDLANAFSRQVESGRSLEQWQQFPELLANVTPESMQKAMAPCADSLVLTYQGPVDVIKPILDEAGYEYEVVDARERGLPLLEQYDKKAAKKLRQRMEEAAAKEASADAEGEGESEPESDED
ncbi:MAG: insulinase family protein [Myxococcota bacterium]